MAVLSQERGVVMAEERERERERESRDNTQQCRGSRAAPGCRLQSLIHCLVGRR